MADTERRKKLAFHLRHLSVGIISNDGFENNLMDDVTYGWLPEQYYRSKHSNNDDQIILPIVEACWSLYTETRRYKLTGPYKVPDDKLKIIARIILFLQTDKEYEWPYYDIKSPVVKFSFKDWLLFLLTLGQNFRIKRKEQIEAYNTFQLSGDYEYWPFYRKGDYEDQLKSQPFLKGPVKEA